MHERHEHEPMGPNTLRRHYGMLALNLIVSLAIMYLAMFTMIWSFADFFNNLNMAYMALVMWAPMAVVMMLTMGAMYADRRLNFVLYAAFALIFALSLWGMRAQALVGDRQFLRSMIPHHSGAVLMCGRAKVQDPEIVALCGRIIKSQKQEIDQMKAILDRN